MKNIYRFLPLLFLLALVFAASIAIYNSSTKDEISNEKMQNIFLDKPFKFEKSELIDVFDKNKIFLANDLKSEKNKFFLINFFASWCSTCLIENQVLLDLKKENLIEIYGVAFNDFSENIVDFLEKNGNPYNKVFLDRNEVLAKNLGVKSVPELFLVDEKGFVVAIYKGAVDKEILQEILYFVKQNQ